MNQRSNQPDPYLNEEFGDYIVIRKLGSGGESVVYLGQDKKDPKNLKAIKVFTTRLAGDYFQKNHIALNLEHPHIIKVHEYGFKKDVAYIIMDYIPGDTLRRRHGRGTKVSLEKVISYVEQVASALQYAHDQGVIHCDVKPENMLIGDDDQILLSDFSLAIQQTGDAPYNSIQTAFSTLGRERFRGTPIYMPPERFRHETWWTSDQYSLAVVVYEWLAGRLPFDPEDAPFQLHTVLLGAAHQKRLVPSLCKRNPDIPRPVEEVVMKALAKKPEDRYSSVQVFADALKVAAGVQAGIPATHVSDYQTVPMDSPRGGGKRLLSRRKLVAVGAIAGGVVIVGGSAFFLFGSHRPPTPLPNSRGKLIARYEHDAIVTAVALSPDGKRVVSADAYGNIQIRSVDVQARLLGRASNYKLSVEAITWSPTGENIAYTSGDGRLQLMDEEGNPVGEPYDSGSLKQALALAWWSEHLFLGLGQEVRVFDDVLHRNFGDRDSTYQKHNGLVNAIACSPAQKNTQVASGSDDFTVQLWMAETSQPVFLYDKHRSSVRAVAWSPDGNHIVSGSDQDAQVWDAQGTNIGSTLTSYSGHKGAVNALAWSPDSQYIASGSDDGTIQLWRAKDGHTIYTYPGHTKGVIAVAWSPDGGIIVSGGYDRTVQVWQAM